MITRSVWGWTLGAATLAATAQYSAPAGWPGPRLGGTSADSLSLLPLDSLTVDRTLPRGWIVRPVRGERAPQLALVDSAGARALRLSGVDRAAWFVRELEAPIVPGGGSLAWSWRVLTPPLGADLRRRDADDSALRVFVVFERTSRFDRVPRTLFYTSGTIEDANYERPSFQSSNLYVIRFGDVGTAGSWQRTTVDPFADYRRVWGGPARSIVAFGIMQDSEQTKANATADIRALVWRSGSPRPAP